MKILFVSSSPLKKEISIGNTFINLFKDMEDVELASVYTRAGAPDKEISQAFCITEKMLIKNLIKKTPVGICVESDEKEEIPKTKSIKNEQGIINFVKNCRLTVFFWLQDFIWRIGKWKSPELKKFVEEFNPDIIFTVLSGSPFLNRLILHITSLSNKKLVLYAWDNNYSLKQFMLSPLRWINHFINRATMRKVAKKADLFYVISDVQKTDYEKAFKKECKVLTKVADFSGEPTLKTDYNKPLQLVYTGNIGLNRWKVLGEIANTLEKINRDGVKAQLRIYTGNSLNDKMNKALNRGESSFVMGSVSADEVLKIQNEADMLVHVESKDLKNRLLVRQSFSTKIVDYLKAARPILAVGPKEVASIDYFIKNDCAIVADNENELYEKLIKIIEDDEKLNILAEKSYESGRNNHNEIQMRSVLKNDLSRLTK